MTMAQMTRYSSTLARPQQLRQDKQVWIICHTFISFIHIIHLTILGGILAAMPGAGFHHHHNHHHHGAGGGIGAGGIVLVEEMDSDNDNDDFAGVPGPGNNSVY